MKELRWEEMLLRGLAALGKSVADLSQHDKGRSWLLALGCYLHEYFLIPYKWLSERFHAGPVKSLANRIRYYQRCKKETDEYWHRLMIQHSVA